MVLTTNAVKVPLIIGLVEQKAMYFVLVVERAERSTMEMYFVVGVECSTTEMYFVAMVVQRAECSAMKKTDLLL